MSKFLPFAEALAVARSLNLASKMEWNVWCKEGMRPAYLPARPDKTYKGAGWQGWVHWLGSSDLKPPPFLPFDQALAFARSLGLASKMEWKVWCKEGMRPDIVPAAPDQTYQDGGWQGWGHWLGSSDPKLPPFLPFDQALAVARSLRLASAREWGVWCKEGKRPPSVPADPHKVYKDGGWQGWCHWLGTSNQADRTKHWLGSSDLKPPPFLPFDQALAVAQSLRLASAREWQAWCKEGKRPATVPARPDRAYEGAGWQGWGHWLGTGNHGNPNVPFLPFDEALAVAHSLNLASSSEWQVWCKEGMRPAYLPADPRQAYKDGGWQGWVHWLGSSDLKPPPFLSFAQALVVARSLGLANKAEWREWCKEGMRPAHLPSNPHQTYKDGGWQGWGHWLGSSDPASPRFLPFSEALAVARSLKLASSAEWKVWRKAGMRPATVPANPQQTYKECGWQGWPLAGHRQPQEAAHVRAV